MAVWILLAPLLVLGTVPGPAQAEIKGCLWLWNATQGNFSVGTSSETYQANTTYVVTIRDDRDHSNSSGQFLLQALSPRNSSVGRWQGVSTESCGSVDTAVLKINESSANWTSPDSNLSSVLIRVYLSLADNSTELKTVMLNTGAGSTSVPPTTPSSVSAVRSSSFFIAALQLPLVLLTGSLLS